MRISLPVFVIFAAFSAVIIACGSADYDPTGVPATQQSDRVQPTTAPAATPIRIQPTGTTSSGFPFAGATATARPRESARPDSTPAAHPTATAQPVTVPGSRYGGFTSEPDRRRPTPVPSDNANFQDYGVNPFVWADEERFSTFGMDVDTASYTITRAYLLDGQMPPEAAVRVEEFVNYFEVNYPPGDEALALHVDGARNGFGSRFDDTSTHLLRIGIAAYDLHELDRKSVTLTFVVDTSGSMRNEGKMELAKRSLERLVDALDRFDRVGIVAYESNARVILEPTSDRNEILRAIDRLQPGGSTNAEAGLVLGYDMATENYDRNRNNRVVLISDGVANVGRTGADGILQRIEDETQNGITLTAIGVGITTYNDVLLEQLADNGNGNYYYIDDDIEARRLFGEELLSVLETVARDAKVQVEFNPAVVDRYRLVGYENRALETEDFRDNSVDAGEVGAGHQVTALYELELNSRATRGPVATVSIRYEDENTGEIREIAREIFMDEIDRRFETADPEFRFIASVAEFAEVLRGSFWSRDTRLEDVLDTADEALRFMDHGPEEDEFLTLVQRVIRMDR